MRRALPLLLLLAFAACAREESTGPDPEDSGARLIARVDGEKVARGVFEAYLRDNINLLDESGPPPPGGEGATNALSEDVRSRLLDRFLLEQALLGQARKAGLEASPEELDAFSQAMGLGPLATFHEGAPITEREYLRKYLEDCYLAKRYLDTVVLKDVKVGDEEVEAHYRQHASEFSAPDRYRLRLIRVDSLQEAQEALRQIGKDPASFAKVAGSLSEGTEGEQGKDLGMWRADELPESIARAVAPLRKGELSGVVEDPEGGFNIFLVEDKVEGGTEPLETVRDRLRTRLAREKKGTAQARFLDQLRRQVRIEIVHENLGFHYVPRPAEGAEAAASPVTTPSPGGAS